MAEVTPELMFEVLKAVQAQLAQVDGKLDELKLEMRALKRSFEQVPELSDAPRL
jgi:hypothetical protein